MADLAEGMDPGVGTPGAVDPREAPGHLLDGGLELPLHGASARGLELPKRKRPWWHYALVVGFIGLAIFTVVSMIRRGSSGWAWLFWAAAFSLLAYLLYSFLTRGGSGGFGGGSFGGGFSGGGGASGSW